MKCNHRRTENNFFLNLISLSSSDQGTNSNRKEQSQNEELSFEKKNNRTGFNIFCDASTIAKQEEEKREQKYFRTKG
jgi:hypothetical protein